MRRTLLGIEFVEIDTLHSFDLPNISTDTVLKCVDLVDDIVVYLMKYPLLFVVLVPS